jgi:hypothetical protein
VKLVELTSSYGYGVLQCGYVQGEAIQNGARPTIRGNTMGQLLQRCLEDNRLICQYKLWEDIPTHTAGTTEQVNECFCYFSKLHLMNWGYKEPGCLANSGNYHCVICLSRATLRAMPDPSGAGGPIGYCRLHPPSPTLAMRERLKGILRCLAISSTIFRVLSERSIFGAV